MSSILHPLKKFCIYSNRQKHMILPDAYLNPITILAPRRNRFCFVPIFVCTKISHMRRLSSSFAKRHASLRLLVCKRTRNGSCLLPPFCD